MKIFLSLFFFLLFFFAAMFVWSRYELHRIEAKLPPVGTFTKAIGAKTHYLDIPGGEAGAVPIVFVHGASGNLNDPRFAFEPVLKGKRRLIFLDRPGSGYSERGGADNPSLQALRYLGLLDELGIGKAVFVGHSLGSASVAAFAVEYPERVAGLIFLAPATHPWPGGVAWYYKVASIPVLGHLFSETLTIPIGLSSLAGGVKEVFKPQTAPKNYAEDTQAALVLRPKVFRANAFDVASLNGFVKEFSPRYKEIKAPTVIITGDKDDVVLPSIHSVGLERDIEGAKLVVLEGVGHKPDYAGTKEVLDALELISR